MHSAKSVKVSFAAFLSLVWLIALSVAKGLKLLSSSVMPVMSSLSVEIFIDSVLLTSISLYSASSIVTSQLKILWDGLPLETAILFLKIHFAFFFNTFYQNYQL